MLHTVNKSAFETDSFKSCLKHAQKGDAVLLYEDAVLGALKGSTMSAEIWSRRIDIKFYVLGPDVAARGLAKDKLIDGIAVIDYGGFVDLVAAHKRTQSWL